MDYKQELKKWISADYERRVKQWMASDPAQLLDDAEAIAATQLIRDNIDEAINDQDAKFLLGLDDPLGYLTGRWISEMAPRSLTRRNFCTVYGRSNRNLAMFP